MRYVWSCYVDMIDSINIYQNANPEEEAKFITGEDSKVFHSVDRVGDRSTADMFTIRKQNYVSRFRNFTAQPNTPRASVIRKQFMNIESTAKFQGASSNLQTCPAHLIERFFDAIQKISDNKGNSHNVRECRISKLDIAQTVALPRPFAEYGRIFRHLELYEKFRMVGEFNNSTVYFPAPYSSKFRIYDKGFELDLRPEEIQSIGEAMGLPSTRSIIRFEHSLHNNAAIQKFLKVTSVNQLIGKAQKIENDFKESLTKALNQISLPDADASFENEVAELLLNAEDYSHDQLNQMNIKLLNLLSLFYPGHIENKIERLKGSVRRNSRRTYSIAREVAKTGNQRLSAPNSELINELIDSLKNPIVLTQSDFERDDKVLQFSFNSEAS
jgi:hypothetical protein